MSNLAVFNPITESDHLGANWLEWYDAHKVFHPGCDLNGKGPGDSDLGNKFYCPLEGQVIFVSRQSTYFDNNGGFGNHCVVFHPSLQLATHYLHANKIDVVNGQQLGRGDLMGEVGKTGTGSAHLHFEVWTPDLLRIQEQHSQPYRFYPKGKTKSWVEQHYVSPYVFMDMVTNHYNERSKHWGAQYENIMMNEGYVTKRKPLDEPPTRAEVYKFISIIEQKYGGK